MSGNFSKELNALAETLGVKNRVTFYDGDLFNVINAIAPYGKVAALHTKAFFTEFGKDFTEKLKAAGVKSLNFIMPEGVSLNLENVFEVIGVPEDVRAVVVTSRELLNLAAYLATVFNIPLVYSLTSFNSEDTLNPKAPFFWGNGTDFFPITCDYHIVIDVDGEKGDIAEQYINVVSKITALSDYRVKLELVGGKPENVAFGVIKDAVLSAFSPNGRDGNTLLLSGLKTELANLASNGAILYNSAEYCFKRLVGLNSSKGLRFAFFKKLLEFYKFCAENGEEPFNVPDYNKRAQEFIAVTHFDDGAFLNGLIKQAEYFNKGKKFLTVKSSFKSELSSQAATLAAIEQRYLALGGEVLEDFSPYYTAFKLCGDLPDTMNFMTLARESGFTEVI